MTLVQGGELLLAQPFYDGEDGHIDESHVRVGVPLAELPHPPVVFGHSRPGHGLSLGG